MNSHALLELKRKLQLEFGSLRSASRSLEIGRWRLSSILNGWITPTTEEAKKLGLRRQEKTRGNHA